MVKIGVIGGGKWGKNHLKDLSRMSCCTLVGISDQDDEKRALAEKYSILFFNDFKEMLPHVDAVTIVTPTNTHYELAKYCLNQGKSVFVEKPLCFDLKQSEELVKLAKEKGLILGVGYVFRFNPLTKRLKELLPEIGDIQYISGRYIHSTVPPRRDSGVVFNLAVHLIDILNFTLPQPPKSIFCKQTNYISKNNEDSALITLDYGNFVANLETSCCHPLKKRDMWIIASKEKIYLDFLDQVMIRYPITISEDGTISKEAVRDPLVEKTSPLFEELWNFCTILNKKMNGEPFENQSAENLLTTKLCVLALDSAHKDETIKLGGQKMNLENNSEKEDLSVEPCSNIKKKVIMVTGCGGAPTINFVRSLRDADPKREKYHIIGIDANQHTIHRNECDKAYLCPRVDDEKYIPFVKKIIEMEKVEYIHTQPEIEVFTIGKNRDEILSTGAKLFMPSQKTIEILRDKGKSYKIWKEAGLKVPENMDINNVDDLKNAFEKFGGEIWIRETIGAAGKGALSKPNFELAKAYIDSRDGWGKTVAAQHLTNRTTTWQSLWHNGRLVVGQGRERRYWEMSNRTQSGVTGLTGTGQTIKDPIISELAIKCVLSVDSNPNGIFSVDFTYDKEGYPNPTEINIGKFFTTHHFITRAGCNMPEKLVDLAFGEYKGEYNLIDPCKENICWVRGMDVVPVMLEANEIDEKVAEHTAIMQNL